MKNFLNALTDKEASEKPQDQVELEPIMPSDLNRLELKNFAEQKKNLSESRFGDPSFSLFHRRENEERDRQLGERLWLNRHKKRSELSKLECYGRDSEACSKAFLAYIEAHKAFLCWKKYNLFVPLERFKNYSLSELESHANYELLPKGFSGVFEQYQELRAEERKADEVDAPSSLSFK